MLHMAPLNLKMWFNARKRAKKPPGSQSNNPNGRIVLYECTIQCEVKNILYAFLSLCVHFSVLLLFFVVLLLSWKAQKVKAECAAHQKEWD